MVRLISMKRRDFLSTGVATGAGLLLTPLVAQENVAQSQSPEKLRVAVAGCGRQGRALINAGMKISNMRFVAVCDILPSALNSAKLYLEFEDENNGENGETDTVAAYRDFQEMIDKERKNIDAVVVATPDFVHAEQTVTALNAGLHVYCEPMMATNVGDAREMVRTSKKTGRLLQVGYERRSDPRYLHAAKNLLNPESRDLLLGTITHFETQANRRVHAELIWAERDTLPPEILAKYGYDSMSQYRNWKQYHKYCNGQCATNFAQQIDVFEWFFGVRPEEIRAMGGLDYYKFGDCDDNAAALLSYRFSRGIVQGISRVWMTTSGGGVLPFEHVFGELGSLQTSLSEGLFRLHAEPGLAKWNEFVRRGDLQKENVAEEGEDPNLIKVRETGNVVPYLIPVGRSDSVFRLHLENFVNAVSGKEPLNCSGDDAFASHVIAWNIIEAVQTGNNIRLTEEMFHI